MAKAVISSVLESLLGKYVDGLSGDSLQVGLWSGELTLQNLTLKPHALAELQLPITVVNGSIRRVHVVVPWNQLGSASVQVAIEGVYALVTPNTKLPSVEEIRQAKRSLVERQELLRQHDRIAKANNQEGEDESTFLSRLMMRIVDNLQITLRDVHLRYEDKVSNPDVPFACGLMIQSFTFHTTDAEGNDVFVDRTTKKERFLHKAATLASFGIYWDRLPRGDEKGLLQNRSSIAKALGEMVQIMVQKQGAARTFVRDGKDGRLWVVQPCDLRVRITKNETMDFSRTAKYTVHSELNNFSCALSREQYEDILFLNRAFASRRAIEARFLNARCRPFHSPKDRPRQWWDYAVRLALSKKVLLPGRSEYKKLKTVRLRLSSVRLCNGERRRYVDAFRMQLRKGSPLDPNTKEAKVQSKFEITYPADVIMAIRDYAEDAEAKAQLQRLEAEKSAAAAQQSSGSSWYGYFFGTASAQSPASISAETTYTDSQDSVLSAEGRANLKKAYDEAVEHEISHEVPTTCNLFAFKVHLRRGQLALYQTRQSTPFFVSSLDASLGVDVRPTFDWETRCRVQHFEILNGLAEGTPYHQFCSLGANSEKSSPCASLEVGFDGSQEAAREVEDEVVKVNAVRIRFTMAPVRLMVDPSFVAYLQSFFVSMLPADQLDRVWNFATSSVSEWIFSDEDEDELYRQTLALKPRMKFDVGVDFTAPVVVISESISDASSATIVIDFGRFKFQNELPPAKSTIRDRLYWSTEMSKVNVLLGRLESLPPLGSNIAIDKFDHIVEQFNITFAVESTSSSTFSGPKQFAVNDAEALVTPNISAKAMLPSVVLKVSESQITSLGRIHSSLNAQMFGSVPQFEKFVIQDQLAQQEDETSRDTPQVRKTPKEKFALQLGVEIGEVLLRLKQDSIKDAFRLRLSGSAFEMAVFTSQTVVQARLQSMVMEDCLYEKSSKFFYLLSTGGEGEDSPHLIALDVTTFNTGERSELEGNADREADTIVVLRCNVLHIQWNPSSVALLYQILSAYSMALQSHAFTIAEATTPVVAAEGHASSVPVGSSGFDTASVVPPLLFRASLVQLTVTFNKDHLDRQLVRLAIQDVALEYVVKQSNARVWNEVVGHLGNFTATDLSLAKHEEYTPLVGLDTGDHTRVYKPNKRSSSSMEPLMAFVYKWSADTATGSSLKLNFEPVRLVYYHQQVMELVDYLFEGILGAMVAETLATATRMLLTEESASTLFHVVVKRPTLILPIRLQSAAHWCLTADSLVLEHFPSSVIRFRGHSDNLANRERNVELFADGERLSQVVEEGEGEVSVRADCKRVQFQTANIFFASENFDAKSAVNYVSVLRVPTNLAVEVDDLVSAGSFSSQCRALPRITMRVRMDDVAFELNRSEYLAVLSLVRCNFGAEILLSEHAQIEHSHSEVYRPTMGYSYSRTDLEMVTMQIIFEMAAVRCDLYQDSRSGADSETLRELIDQAIDGASSTCRRERLLATIRGTRVSASVNQLHEQWPSIELRVDSFFIQDRATRSLLLPDGREDAYSVPGIVFRCDRPFSVSYAWDTEQKQSKIELDSDDLHGIVIPESVLMLLDYFAPHSVEESASLDPSQPVGTLVRRKSITAAILNEPISSTVSGNNAYELTVGLRGRNMSIAFPEDVFNGESEQVAMRADFNVSYKWKPASNELEKVRGEGSDLDIQSSLAVHATGIEVFSRNAKRQGCASSSTAPLVQILEPCDVHVEISDLFPHAGQQQQIVAVRFSPIEVYASYEDSCVVMSAVESATSSYERHSGRVGVSPPRKEDADVVEAFSSTVEIHRYFTCEVGAMSLTLINDCDGCDMGLLQLQTQRCNLFLNVTYTPPLVTAGPSVAPPTTTLSGGGNIVTLISYYNPDSRDWHPMCSEWGVDVSLQGSVFDNSGKGQGSENELHVIVTANRSLDLAVTHGLLEVFASAGGAWNRRSSQLPSPTSSPSSLRVSALHGRRRQAKAPSVIRNDTGLPLTFWLSTSSETDEQDGASSLSIVPSGNVADLHYTHSRGRGCGVARKYASRDRTTNSMRLHLHLADAPFQPIHDIEFEQLGSRAYHLLDGRSGSNTRFMLNFNSQLVDGRIVVTVSSQVKVVSTLSMPIQLLVNDPTWASPVEIGILYPHRESAVPVMVSLGTELRVRPLADAVYGWSAPIPIQTRSEVDLRVESSSAEAARNAIFCVAMTLEESLRVVTFAEPIVLINKLPVDLAFRVKSSHSASGTGTGSTASPRERMQVGEKRGVWWTDHRYRPQFELAVNGCQTSRWIELTQAANMSSKSGGTTGDVVSVMLLRQDGRPFKLLLQIVEQPPAKSLHIHLYAEIWFINRTGLDLVYGNESEAESYFPPANARTLVGNAQISAYSSSSESPTPGPPNVRLSMPSCAWSSRFAADPRRLSWQDECLTLKADSERGGGNGVNVLYEFGISADYSTRHFGSITTLISVIPRYLVINQSSHTVLLLEDTTGGKSSAVFTGTGEAHHILAKGDSYALYWVTGTRCRLRTSVLSDFGQFGWSEGISYDQVKSHSLAIPLVSHDGMGPTGAVKLQVSIKQGSISQASLVIMITDQPEHETSKLDTPDSRGSWDIFTIHTQLAGLIVTVADKQVGNSVGDSSSLFGTSTKIVDENVARLTVTRITAELSSSTQNTSVRLNVMGIKLEDLLHRSKNPVVLRPVNRNDSFSSSRREGQNVDKCFLSITFLEKPHPKYRWIERILVEVQDVRVATTMQFVDRLNKLVTETLAHFDSHAYATTLSIFDDSDSDASRAMRENILEYFVTTDDDGAMASITGHKVYIESCEIAPVRVVVSFSREKGGTRNDPNAGFWLSNLKFKIDNAYLTLDAFKLSHAMATQEALVESLSAFYVKSVKSQALGLIESVQVTTLVTSVVASGVSSLVSTIMGKTDPSLANAKNSFQYQFLTNNQLITKHSKMLSECQSTAQFLQQVKHLVYDWDSNHTGLEARGCVALGILNNSRHSLVVNAHLNDGAEIRVLPVGRKHLASAMGESSGSDPNSWRSDRSMVIFAWGYTPTLLTSGDVYFTVQSNACNVFVTRKTARLKANIGYTATFTHQEKQQWWSTNVVIVGDDLHGHVSGASNLFGDTPSTPLGMAAPALPPMPLQPSQSGGMLDAEYEVVFTTPSLGLIAKQSGPRQVIVRECLVLENGAPSPALACGKIAPGDTILTVSGVAVTNTSQFRDLVGQSPRPVVLRFRRTGDRFGASEAYDLFGEKQPRGDSYDLFGVGTQ